MNATRPSPDNPPAPRLPLPTAPLLTLLLAALLLAAGCATNPVTGKRELQLVDTAREIAIGTEHYGPTRQLEGGDYVTDPALLAYVSRIGQRLARVSDRPDLPYDFVVLNNPVPNAWALPGGKIAVNRGLLTELANEAELAAVLAHEIVHAAARHGARQMEQGMLLSAGVAGLGAALGSGAGADLASGAARFGSKLINARYGRDHELESDRYGIEYMVRAGYDPHAAVTLQETFVRLSEGRKSDWVSGLFASHPPSRERVAANRERAARLGGGKLGTDEYQRAIAGLKASLPAYQKAEQANTALADGKPQTAIRYADQAIALFDKEADFYAIKGRALLALAEADDDPALYRQAEQALSNAVRRNDRYFAYPLLRGVARARLHQNAKARADLTAANTLLPTATGHYQLGLLDRAAGDTESAIAHFQAAAGDGPTGRLAAVALLELKPSVYIATAASLGDNGRIAVQITNRSPLAIKGIVLRLDPGVAARPSTLRIDGPLGPGQSTRVQTHIPALSAYGTTRLAIQVTGAAAVMP